jgi:heme exporter protein D
MSDIGAFFEMGGYAGYVWPAYGVAIAALGGLAVQSWRHYRQSARALERLQQGGRRPR